MSPSHHERPHRVLPAFVVFAVALSFGLGFGNANQNTYLIEGLTKLHPAFLRYDWFARETIHYHPTFAYVVQLAGLAGPLGWNLVLLNSACSAISLFFAYKIAGRLSATNAFAVFLLFACLVVIERTVTLGATFMFSPYLQPSVFGYTLTMIALWYFVDERDLASGVALAAAGFFHINFLLLGILFFGLAHCLLGRAGLAKRLAAQLAGSLAILAYNFPFLLALATDEQAERARVVFMNIRAPHHYLPMTYLWDFVPFAAWNAAALGSLRLADIEPAARRRATAMYFSLLLILATAAFLTTVVFVPIVTRLFFWRMAPFSVMFAQLICLSAAVRYLVGDRDGLPAVSARREVVFGASLLAIAIWYRNHFHLFSARQVMIAVYFGTIGLLLALLRNSRRGGALNRSAASVQYAALALLVASLCAAAADTWARSTILNGFPGAEEAELYSWAQQTAEKALFVIPPDLENFRMHAERAVVVDWKSIPVDADGVLQWHSRIADVCGDDAFHSLDEAMAGFAEIDAGRLHALSARYGATHLVRYVDPPGGAPMRRLPQFTTVFRNRRFEVKGLATPGSGPPR